MTSHACHKITTASNLEVYFTGPPIEEGPRPALFYFALSGHQSLTLDPFNQPGVEYVPYWRAGDLQTVGPERVYVSLFRNGKKALLAMYNDNPKPVTATWMPTERFKLTGEKRIVVLGKHGIGGQRMYPYFKLKGAEVYIPPYDYCLAIAATDGDWGAPDSWGPVDPKLFERNVKKVERK